MSTTDDTGERWAKANERVTLMLMNIARGESISEREIWDARASEVSALSSYVAKLAHHSADVAVQAHKDHDHDE
jgi:hypothetical protein